jgi:hypothetical protein
MVYMPMGGLQVAHMLNFFIQLSYVPWGRRVMHMPRRPYLVPYAYILHPYEFLFIKNLLKFMACHYQLP